MTDKVIETMDDIEKYGNYWERHKEMNLRCVSPSSADKMRVLGAAPYIETGGKMKVAAGVAKEETEAATATSSPKTMEHKMSKKDLKRGTSNPPRVSVKTGNEGGSCCHLQTERDADIPSRDGAGGVSSRTATSPSEQRTKIRVSSEYSV